jgi:hypothetical protein
MFIILITILCLTTSTETESSLIDSTKNKPQITLSKQNPLYYLDENYNITDTPFTIDLDSLFIYFEKDKKESGLSCKFKIRYATNKDFKLVYPIHKDRKNVIKGDLLYFNDYQDNSGNNLILFSLDLNKIYNGKISCDMLNNQYIGKFSENFEPMCNDKKNPWGLALKKEFMKQGLSLSMFEYQYEDLELKNLFQIMKEDSIDEKKELRHMLNNFEIQDVSLDQVKDENLVSPMDRIKNWRNKIIKFCERIKSEKSKKLCIINF